MKEKFLNILRNKHLYILIFLIFSICVCIHSVDAQVIYDRSSDVVTTEDTSKTLKLKKGDTLESVYKSSNNTLSGCSIYTSKTEIDSSFDMRLDVYVDNVKTFSKEYSFERLDTDQELGFAIDTINDTLNKDVKISLTLLNSKKDIKLVSNKDSFCLKVSTSDLSNYMLVYKILSRTFAILFILSYIVIMFKFTQIHNLFFVLAIVFGITVNLFIPIGMVPDESVHVSTAYHYSNKLMGIKEDSSVMMRTDDVSTISHYYNDFGTYPSNALVSSNIYDLHAQKLENDTLIPSGYGYLNVVPWQFTYYIAAIGITVGRLLKLGSLLTINLGRIFNLLFFAFVARYSIKKIKAFKNVLFVVGLLPITLQQACSTSYDGVVYALSFLVIALSMNLIINEEFRRKDQIILGISCLMLFVSKQHAYVFISLLPSIYFIKKYDILNKLLDYLKKYKKYVLSGTILILFAFISLLYLKRNSFEDTSIFYLLTHMRFTLKLFSNTLYQRMWQYITSSLNNYMGLVTVQNDTLVIALYITVMALIMFKGDLKKEELKIPNLERFVYIMINFVTVFAILFAMYQWSLATQPGMIYTYFNIEGYQGRYAIPVLSLLMIGCIGKYQTIYDFKDKMYLFAGITLPMLTLLSMFIAFR